MGLCVVVLTYGSAMPCFPVYQAMPGGMAHLCLLICIICSSWFVWLARLLLLLLFLQQLRDLLAPETSSRLRLVENAKGEVVCLNQSRVEVRSPGDVTDVLQAIGAHSATEPTKLNSASKYASTTTITTITTTKHH